MARTSLRKPSRAARDDSTESSWRDHPVVVAAISAGAAVTLMGSVVFPLLTTHLNSQLEEARKDVETKKVEIAQLKGIADRLVTTVDSQNGALKKHEDDKKKLADQLRQYAIDNPFLLPTAYPRGLEVARVGSTAADVEAAYSGRPIDKSKEDYWSIEPEHPIFSPVTYYFRDGVVTHILFHTRYKGPLEDVDILPLVKRYFGKPNLSIDENNLWVTESPAAERLTADNDGALVVYAKDAFPNWVSRAYEKCQSNTNRDGDLGAFCRRLASSKATK